MKAITTGGFGMFVISSVLLLSACGSFMRDAPEYTTSEEVQELDVPEDLDHPNLAGALVIPEDDEEEETYLSVTEEPPIALVQYQDGVVAETETTRLAVDRGSAGLLVKRDPAATWELLNNVVTTIPDLEVVGTSPDRMSIDVQYSDVQSAEDRPSWFSRFFLRRSVSIDMSGLYRIAVEEEGATRSQLWAYNEHGLVDPEVGIEILALLQPHL